MKNSKSFISVFYLLLAGLFLPQAGRSQADVGSKYCLYFGGDDYMRTTYVTNFGYGTMEAWIKPYADGVIAGKSGNANCNDVTFIITGGKLKANFTNGNCSEIVGTTSITGTTTLVWGQWYHVAITWAAAGTPGMRLYLNGNLEISSAVGRSMTSNAQFFVGQTSYNSNFPGTYYPGGGYYTGYMDEFRFWASTSSTAGANRSQDSIRANMHRRITWVPVGTILRQYWRFDDGTGAVATNTSAVTGFVSGDLVDGTLNGPAWVLSSAPFATGASAQQTIAAPGSFTFTGTNLSMNVTAKIGPDDFFVTNCLNSPEGILPDSIVYAPLNNNYWIINKYGTGTITTDVTFTLPAGIVTSSHQASPSSLKLLRRGSTEYLCWTQVATASAAVAATGEVTFQNLTDPGQYMITGVAPVVATITGDTAVCNGQSITLYATGGGTYLWSTGSTLDSIVVSPTSTTTYSVTVTVGTNSATASHMVTVNQPPVAGISGPTSVCSGQSITLTANGGGMYSWSTGASTASITESPSSTTTYNVMVTDANGCTDSESVTVTVNPTPAAPVATSNSAICEGDMLNLMAGTITGAGYSWSGPLGFSSAQQNPSINNAPVAASGTYTVIATVGGCTSSPGTVTVVVNPSPVVNIGPDTIICLDMQLPLNAGNFSFYNWSDGSTGSSILLDGATLGIGNYTFYVDVTNADNCSGSDSVHVIVSPCLGLEAAADMQVNISPNPSAGFFNIITENPSGGTMTAQVFTAQGQLVRSTVVVVKQNNQLDLSDLAKGFYFLELNDGSVKRVFKIVLE